MQKFANVIIDISHEKVDRAFQYRIPEALQGSIKEGMEVRIPFGKGNTQRTGYVIEVTDQEAFEEKKMKEILGIAEGSVTVEGILIRLAYWIKEHYGATMITALKTVLPVKQKVKAVEVRKVEALVSPEKLSLLKEQAVSKKQTAKARVLEALLENPIQPYGVFTGKLQITSKTIAAFEKQGVLAIHTESQYRNPVKMQKQGTVPKVLSQEQRHIVEDVLKDYADGRRGTYLIHGITGSGKTEVYMELISGVIEKGRQAIVLIPEIALTFQTVMRFYEKFGDRVSVMHSKLSAGEKYDQFQRARGSEIDICIGPRSALFTPFGNLGLIIIDEEHEGSYKSEQMPKFHAREVAMEIARMHNASLVLGSATPSLEAYYMAEQGSIKKYELTERLTGGHLPTVYIEDLRKELKEGNRSIFSRRLQKGIADRLEKGQQIMLFLNRRGYAGFVSCRACGHVMKCPHCDVSLSEHKRSGKLICHYCGYEEAAVNKCPSCSSQYILGFKAGTQQIEEVLGKKFPNARVLRMDADTTRQKHSYEEILSAFANGEADILVGTQMIVKGHDFPNVTLVGVLAADLSLSANDYRAGERTFQLLTQAAGRAGRGMLEGEVVIQTYQPDHYSIRYAAEQDYKGFYQEEILYREMMSYPPAANMMVVLVYGKKEKEGWDTINEIDTLVRQEAEGSKTTVIGPSSALIGKINDCYRFTLYIKSKKYDTLTMLKNIIEEHFKGDDNKRVTVQFDFNPMNIY